MSWFLNAVLLAVVVALGAFAYFKPRNDQPVSHDLSTLRADQVKAIRIERGGGPSVALEKKDDRWFITAPFAAQADPFQVQRLLAILDAKPSVRLTATALARYDLDHPRARLVIDGQTFDFGTVNPVTREQYVLTAGAVFPVDARYGAALAGDGVELIRKQLFASGEVPVAFEGQSFSLAQSGAKWRLTPEAGQSSQDELIRWVDAWRQASALRVEPYAGHRPIAELRVALKDGRTLSLGILQRDPELVLVRPDEKLQYYFASAAARHLLTPPGKEKRATSNQ